MGKSKALETALNNKLLGSHEHLKKGIFSPPLYTNIYSAKRTIEYCLQLNSELIFEPISVELVLDWEHTLVALLHIRQYYLP